MAFLDAKALQDDPIGMAFLRDVIAPGEGQPAMRPKGFGAAATSQRLSPSKQVKTRRREPDLVV